MFSKKRCKISIIGICFVVFIGLGVKQLAFADVKPITETKDRLEELSWEEKSVLENLFDLTQEIMELEKEENRISNEITQIDSDTKELEEQIINSQKSYNAQLDILQQVLIGYQKKGPVSYIDTLMNSGDLKTFVRSLNIIREFSKNTASLLDSLWEQNNKLAMDKENLSKTLVLLEDKREELKEPLLKKKELKEEQEKYLHALGEQRELYRVYLSDMEQKWEENKELFKSIVEDFATVINNGKINVEDLNIVFSFLGITGTIYEDTFHNIFQEHNTLSLMKFIFLDDSITIDIPSLHLRLNGTFELEDGSNLKLLVNNGSFYDIPLEPSSLNELFAEGDIRINVKEMVQDMVTIDFTIESVSIKEGRMEFKIIPKFF